MSKEHLESLKEIMDSYSRLHPIGNKSQRNLAFSPVKTRIQNLIISISDTPYANMIGRLDDLMFHLKGSLGTRGTDGYTPDKHKYWARHYYTVLERNFKKEYSHS